MLPFKTIDGVELDPCFDIEEVEHGLKHNVLFSYTSHNIIIILTK